MIQEMRRTRSASKNCSVRLRRLSESISASLLGWPADPPCRRHAARRHPIPHLPSVTTPIFSEDILACPLWHAHGARGNSPSPNVLRPSTRLRLHDLAADAGI